MQRNLPNLSKTQKRLTGLASVIILLSLSIAYKPDFTAADSKQFRSDSTYDSGAAAGSNPALENSADWPFQH
jgi:hypothetical protein